MAQISVPEGDQERELGAVRRTLLRIQVRVQEEPGVFRLEDPEAQARVSP